MSAAFRNLPSLQALRCFEAAARLGSFALAAEELRLTQSAISHQIRSLEEGAGQRLFARTGGGLALTKGGQALAAETRRALDYLSRAYGVVDVRSARTDTFVLAAQVAISEHWLLPRLPELIARLGATSLSIVSLIDLVESVPPHVDAAILYGAGDIPGMVVETIADESVFPVCSPAFLASRSPVTLDRLRELPLLLHSYTTWNLWLEKAGLPIAYPADSIVFDDALLTIRAALDGHGIAMARARLVERHLASGALVRLFDVAVPGIFDYHLAWRDDPTRRRWGEVRDLLTAEFGRRG